MTTSPRRRARLWWPRTLLGRNLLLMVGLILAAQLVTGLAFRQLVMVPRLRAAGDATVRNVQAFAQALAALPPGQRAAFVDRFNDRAGEPGAPAAPASAAVVPLTRAERVLLARIDRQWPATAAGPRWRRGPGDSLVVRIDLDDRAYWLDLRGLLPAADNTGAWLPATLGCGLLALAGAWWLQRRLDRPLSRLVDATRTLALGGPAPRLDEDGPTEIATLARAFNEMADALARHARDRDVMLAGLSHDLRTPLAKMRLAVEMIGPDAPADADLLETLKRNVEAIDGLVTQFVAFTRATHPPDEPRRDADLDALVDQALSLCPPDGLHRLPGEAGTQAVRPSSIARIVLNLVANAQKHGAPPIEVATGRATGPGGGPWIEVRDRGPGIAPERVEALKAPFARGDEARGGAAGGAGLGLAIVDRLARAEGGTLSLRPRDGGGLVARVDLRS